MGSYKYSYQESPSGDYELSFFHRERKKEKKTQRKLFTSILKTTHTHNVRTMLLIFQFFDYVAIFLLLLLRLSHKTKGHISFAALPATAAEKGL